MFIFFLKSFTPKWYRYIDLYPSAQNSVWEILRTAWSSKLDAFLTLMTLLQLKLWKSIGKSEVIVITELSSHKSSYPDSLLKRRFMAAIFATVIGSVRCLMLEYYNPGCKKPIPGSAQAKHSFGIHSTDIYRHIFYARHCHEHWKTEGFPWRCLDIPVAWDRNL